MKKCNLFKKSKLEPIEIQDNNIYIPPTTWVSVYELEKLQEKYNDLEFEYKELEKDYKEVLKLINRYHLHFTQECIDMMEDDKTYSKATKRKFCKKPNPSGLSDSKVNYNEQVSMPN